MVDHIKTSYIGVTIITECIPCKGPIGNTDESLQSFTRLRLEQEEEVTIRICPAGVHIVQKDQYTANIGPVDIQSAKQPQINIHRMYQAEQTPLVAVQHATTACPTNIYNVNDEDDYLEDGNWSDVELDSDLFDAHFDGQALPREPEINSNSMRLGTNPSSSKRSATSTSSVGLASCMKPKKRSLPFNDSEDAPDRATFKLAKQLSHQCIICRILHDQDEKGPYTICSHQEKHPNHLTNESFNAFINSKKGSGNVRGGGILMTSGGGCYKCGIPLSFCKAAIFGQKCAVQDVIFPCAWLVWQHESLRNLFLQALDIETRGKLKSQDVFRQWLSERQVTSEGIVASNYWTVFSWVKQYLLDQGSTTPGKKTRIIVGDSCDERQLS